MSASLFQRAASDLCLCLWDQKGYWDIAATFPKDTKYLEKSEVFVNISFLPKLRVPKLNDEALAKI